MEKANVTFCHPSKDGDGSALRAEMHYQLDGRPGFIRLKLAAQDGERFDFADAFVADLDALNAAKSLLVLRGEEESLDGGKPIQLGDVLFAMKSIEGGACAIAACVRNGEETEKRHIVLSRAETLCLRTSVEGAMFFLSFVKGVNP